MIRVAPSILSANFAHLASEIQKVEQAGADWLHIDVMDGHFVPNLTIGPQVVADIRKETNLLLDVHLMIEKPENLIPAFVKAGADILTVHSETCPHLHRVVHMIKDAGIRAGVAINPATSISVLENIIGDVDLILLMSVNPGFGGQSFISGIVDKITATRHILDERGLDADLEVDGGINRETGKQVVEAGVDVLVAGSYIFKAANLQDAVRSLKEITLS
ncbi:MAG: ribulose-phosphate 3-epimerase [Syntrophomonas sp.]